MTHITTTYAIELLIARKGELVDTLYSLHENYGRKGNYKYFHMAHWIKNVQRIEVQILVIDKSIALLKA